VKVSIRKVKRSNKTYSYPYFIPRLNKKLKKELEELDEIILSYSPK